MNSWPTIMKYSFQAFNYLMTAFLEQLTLWLAGEIPKDIRIICQGLWQTLWARTLFSKLYLPVDILAIEFIRKSLALPNTDRRSALALENNTHLFNAFFQKTSGLEKGGVCPYLSLQSQQISSIRFSTSLHSPLASRSSKCSFSGFLIASGTLLNYN